MPRDIEAYLSDMLDAAEFLVQFVQGRTLDDMLEDRGFRLAIERSLENIGEALFQLRRINESVAMKIAECDRIIALRHVLVHGYDQVKPAVLWNIIEVKLPTLIEDVRRAMGGSA